jgi:glucose/arabinose dehydrogenase/mono/diheme cytochrome c family protein
MLLRVIVCSLLLVSVALAQEGDKTGEIQKTPSFPVPPSPALTPDQELKTFKLAPGFHIELVASEPLVEDPIAIEFDPNGRIWVVEMRGFMPNADARGEDQPIGRIVVLEDTDGDGKMDKRTIFADGLVMPRALCLVRDGALVAEPPTLWFMRDTDGDGKADEKTVVAKDYGNRLNPEHNANGLLWAMDNWIYSANFTARFHIGDEDWMREPTPFRGQWGISQDNFGRFFFNANEDQLRCDLVPAFYLFRNPNYRSPVGYNYRVMKDQTVWPVRVNPGVNRGYRPGQLRPDGTLATFTAACAPLIYRGDNFPAEFCGNAFVCEPAGNLVKRDILTEKDIAITGKSAYDHSEFLASTDERFRPVNLCNAPDGALYVVDMYHGIIQHRVYLTSYLRNQGKMRGLEQPLHQGRIYRVIHDDTPRGPAPHLARASSAELVKTLSHPNGWWRDTAQRLLVERDDVSVVPALQAKAASDPDELGRIHALWTLSGMEALDIQMALKSLADPEPKVRAAAIRVAEPLLKTAAKRVLLDHFASMAKTDLDLDTQLQLAFTLGQVTESGGEQGMATIARNSCRNPFVREALLSGLAERELEFTEKLMADKGWNENKAGRSELLRGLAQCVFTGRKSSSVNRLLELAAAESPATAWRRLALLDGLVATAGPLKSKRQKVVRPKPVRFEAQPAAWTALSKLNDARVRDRMGTLVDLVTWPGQPGYTPPPPVVPLTADQQARYDEGKLLFESTCAQCHQPHGLGQEGLAPPLVDSEWVLGPDAVLARIALQGAHGRINVKGRDYSMDMPAFGGTFNDDQLAAILTYVRRSWEHTATPVEPATVKAIRAATVQHADAWTEKELLRIH